MNSETKVLVVGAGPTGLLLAGDLAAGGVPCTVLERRDQESNLTRAFAVHARTLELLDARGLADELVTTGQRTQQLRLFMHARVDLSRLPSRFPYLLVTPQYETERVLRERAEALGVEIVRGAEVTGLRRDGDGVEVDVRTAAGTGPRRAAYVVGADGVHSAVRSGLGVEFPGHAAVQSVMLADVRLAERPPDVLTVGAVGEAFAFIAPYGDGWYRVIAWDRSSQLPDNAPVDLDRVRQVVRTALGTDLGMHDARWMSRFHSDERQATTYRAGRVLLAGDAAHVHSPAGGQGMNTGLQDAANLGWKLAAVVRGDAPDGLLDSYQAERYPVGTRVLRTSGTLLRMVTLESRAAVTARNLLVRAATGLRPINDRLAGEVSGISIRYPAPSGGHRLVGARAADLPLVAAAGGHRRLYEALRAGRFVLVTGRPVDADGTDPTAGIDMVVRADGQAGGLLVRPDGYVAWASDAAVPDQGTLADALSPWRRRAADRPQPADRD